MLEKLILTLQFYFEGLIKAFVDSMCRVFESSLSLAWSESPSPTQMCVYPREFMTLRVAQFSLKIAHLSFSMVLRGPRPCGLRPRLWLLIPYIHPIKYSDRPGKSTERDMTAEDLRVSKFNCSILSFFVIIVFSYFFCFFKGCFGLPSKFLCERKHPLCITIGPA